MYKDNIEKSHRKYGSFVILKSHCFYIIQSIKEEEVWKF